MSWSYRFQHDSAAVFRVARVMLRTVATVLGLKHIGEALLILPGDSNQ